MLEGLIMGIDAMRRVLWGKIIGVVEEASADRWANDTEGFAKQFVERRSALQNVEWSKSSFVPVSLPALEAWLSRPRLASFVPRDLLRINSFLLDYYSLFFATPAYWSPLSFWVVNAFIVESTIAIRVLYSTIDYLDSDEPNRIREAGDRSRFYLSQSQFSRKGG